METTALYPEHFEAIPAAYQTGFDNPDCCVLNWALGKDIGDADIYRHAKRILLHYGATLSLRDARFLLGYIDSNLRAALTRRKNIQAMVRKVSKPGFVGDYITKQAIKPWTTPYPTVEELQGKENFFAFVADTRVGGPTTLVVSNVVSQRNGQILTLFLDSYHSNSEYIKTQDVLAIGNNEHGTHKIPGWSGRFVLLKTPEQIKQLTGEVVTEIIPYLPDVPQPKPEVPCYPHREYLRMGPKGETYRKGIDGQYHLVS